MSDSDPFKANINNNNDPDYLDELRSLIVGPEQTQIAQIEQRINEEQLSEVLPEIIVLSSNKDKRFS